MIRDPWLDWDGEFAYDAFAQVGITPDSSMPEILDALSELRKLDSFDSEKHSLWGELRKPQERLWMDFMLYPVSTAELLAGLDEIGEPIPAPPNPITLPGSAEEETHG
jgi:hypothetical protein